ncbi:hypothetical protein FB446DRAFT_707598 [Lentinula raphanica]|nr:hypothetical protein FB446DRAFT_707598 [Lentinula raphanica]
MNLNKLGYRTWTTHMLYKTIHGRIRTLWPVIHAIAGHILYPCLFELLYTVQRLRPEVFSGSINKYFTLDITSPEWNSAAASQVKLKVEIKDDVPGKSCDAEVDSVTRHSFLLIKRPLLHALVS